MLEIWYVPLPNGPLLSFSNEGLRVQNGPAPGSPWFIALKYIEKIFKNLLLRCLEFGMKHCLDVFYQVCSNEGLRFQTGLSPVSPGF